jgi:hypothetical protein
MDDLKDKIARSFQEIEDTPGLVVKCHLSVKGRAQQYMEKNGGHFEFAR